MIIEYLNIEAGESMNWENQWKVENEVWFCKNISKKNFVVKFISFNFFLKSQKSVCCHVGPFEWVAEKLYLF